MVDGRRLHVMMSKSNVYVITCNRQPSVVNRLLFHFISKKQDQIPQVYDLAQLYVIRHYSLVIIH